MSNYHTHVHTNAVKLYLTDDRILIIPHITTGQRLTAALNVPSITLCKVLTLNNGTLHRCFTFVGPQTEHVDLSEYQELFLANRQWFGRVEPVQEVTHAYR